MRYWITDSVRPAVTPIGVLPGRTGAHRATRELVKLRD